MRYNLVDWSEIDTEVSADVDISQLGLPCFKELKSLKYI